MTSPRIRPLSEVSMADAPEVGGKAASLGELIASGVRVPEGVVLTAAGDLSSDERAALLQQRLPHLGPGPFAVRSSGIAEDGAERSFAGMYGTVLGVYVHEVAAAVDVCLSSADTATVAGYAPGGDRRMAVIVQAMVSPRAAGVVLTADPITTDRATAVVTAVRGIGDRLVSGAAIGDEWAVVDETATARRQPESAIVATEAVSIAREARRISDRRGGVPQDVEWAIDGEGTLWILQARPMTALPAPVKWDPPAPGAFTRQLRLGEWIGEPVTPLFESWLLTAMEERMHGWFFESIGQRAPRPLHVVVNGWYFYSLNWASPRAMIGNLPRMLWHLVRTPRHVAGILPATVRHSFPIMEREWRGTLRPRYQAAVRRAEEQVDGASVASLPALIDELAELAGEAFGGVAALAGAAYKMELNLAGFYRRHLRPSLGGSHLPLLTGFERPATSTPHAVVSLDWRYPPAGSAAGGAVPEAAHDRLVAARKEAENAAFAALAGAPRRLAAFRRLLADAQHLVPLREEQVGELTLAWPVMRRAVIRIGEALVERGAIGAVDDVFFLTRAEALAALSSGRIPAGVDVIERREQHREQARLIPPLMIGTVSPVLKRMIDGMPRVLGAEQSPTALVSGSPASPGRASGRVRIVRGPAEFDRLMDGEILVAPMTAPAWTPLFTRAAAVVTDVGSAAAHASIIAREYGIPAVVGCGDATARLRDGMPVTVDGSSGNVEPG